MSSMFSSRSKKRTSIYFHKHNTQRRNSSDATQQRTQWHLEAGWQNPWIRESSKRFCSMILFDYLLWSSHKLYIFLNSSVSQLFHAFCSLLFNFFHLKSIWIWCLFNVAFALVSFLLLSSLIATISFVHDTEKKYITNSLHLFILF